VLIAFRKLSDDRHGVRVTRADGSSETVELDSKDFLRHDFAHLAFELEGGLQDGVWGSVARGGSLDGTGLDGADVATAERVSGPLQTLIRVGATPDELFDLIARQAPELASRDLAARVHERARALIGHWKATPYGDEMTLEWPFA
jgi:hypothetical protein